MQDKCFWDTNLLVYLNTQSAAPEDLEKHFRAVELWLNSPSIVISVQVLNEFANVLLRKFNKNETDVKTMVLAMLPQVEVVDLTEQLTLAALDMKKKYAFGWFDSLIVAAALHMNCQMLLSEDLQDGLLVEGKLRIVNPFAQILSA